MVKYDYKCKDCEHEFEAQRAYTETKKEKCPNCNKTNTRKIIRVSSIQFRGDGFTLSKSE